MTIIKYSVAEFQLDMEEPAWIKNSKINKDDSEDLELDVAEPSKEEVA